jgi:hypothetical protein
LPVGMLLTPTFSDRYKGNLHKSSIKQAISVILSLCTIQKHSEPKPKEYICTLLY